MKIIPLAFDSFSVRSMATYVETKNRKVLIDPGIALAPIRRSLPPSQREEKAFEKGRKKIMSFLRKAKSTVISHYHWDHHPEHDDRDFNMSAYRGKTVYCKAPENINKSQLKRHESFMKIAEPIAKEIVFADDTEHDDMFFSRPVYHGPEGSRLGWVIMTTLEERGNRVMHCSDVQGPIPEETVQQIIDTDPRTLILGGPPTYFLGWKFSYNNLDSAKKNMLRIMSETNVKEIIYDHHLARDVNYMKHVRDLYDFADKFKIKFGTAAEYLGEDNLLLEGRRKELS